MRYTDKLLLKPATKEDFFCDDQLILNKVYFERSQTTGLIEGPYEIYHGELDNMHCFREYVYKVMVLKTILLPVFEETPETSEHVAVYRPATPDDLKESRADLKVNALFFIYENNKMVGPYRIYPDTNPFDLANYLSRKIIYVLESQQKQLNSLPAAS